MYTHIQIGARDWPRLVAFYDTVLAPLGQPGLRTWYAPDFYAAYCRDPEGNKLAFVCAAGCV
ncbi:hypothetical protein GG851_19185 [Bordetella petrii]|nr:hypothetical protein [Bordetella petrii]